MIGKILLVLSTLALASAQVPSLGFCPDYVPMANFDRNKFVGVWFEAERYFQLTEVVSRCVMANYTLTPDGKFFVSNEVTNRFTGIKRIVEGEIKKPASKAEEGKLIVRYTIPLTPETKYSVLETDYNSYAVLWSCSGIGPFHTQNAWIMTRKRKAPDSVIQKAYAVLDKYKVSKAFFVKTDQADCAYLDNPEAQVVPSQPEEKPQQGAEENNVRSEVAPDAPEVIVESNVAKEEEKAAPVVESVKTKSVNTIPERIMEVADASKEEMPVESAKAAAENETNEAAKEQASEKGEEMEKTA